MKVVLLALNASFTHTSLSARCIGAVCAEAGFELEVVELNINEGAEVIAGRVVVTRPQLLLCSVYIWNRRLMEDVCTRVRLMRPEVVIAWGGPEVSGEGEGILARGHADYVVCGEGEEAVLQLICALEQGKPPEAAGIAWQGGSLPRKESRQDLDNLPFPYADEPWTKNKIYYFETSRGCPYNCTYCLSSREAGVRFMSLCTAKARLSQMVGKVPLIKFVDRTFNADPQRARDLWEFLLELPTETRFHFEVCAHLLTTADFVLLAERRATRFQFEVGLQSASPQSLLAVNRYTDAVQVLHTVRDLVALGTVEVHLDLIAGLPHETLATFLSGLDSALKALPHRLHLGFLKVLPGTELRRQAEELGMVYLPYAPYEVLRTPDMTPTDFLYLKTAAKTLDRYYNSRQAEQALRYVLRLAKITGSQTLERLSVMGENTVQESAYVALQAHVAEPEVLKELCRFDYLMHEPHVRVPDMLLGESPQEERAVRDLVYGDSDRLLVALPHRQGDKPGVILRRLRWGKFNAEACAVLGLPHGGEVLFDHSLPRSTRAIAVT